MSDIERIGLEPIQKPGRSKQEGRAKWYGPVGEAVVRCGDWQIRAEQTRSPIGSPDKWSVFCLHKTGVCVPPGPNLHPDPTAELGRLERMLDCDRGEPRDFSWIEVQGKDPCST